jgi:hypothetical protein
MKGTSTPGEERVLLPATIIVIIITSLQMGFHPAAAAIQ